MVNGVYSINNIVQFRGLDWKLSKNFFYLTEIPTLFEPFTLFPDYYSYGILEQGSMSIEVDNQLHQITDRSFLIYRPEQTLRIVDIAPETEGAFILFTRQFIQDFQPSLDQFFSETFLNKHFGSHIELAEKDHTSLSRVFKMIFEVLSSIYEERWEISARSLITTLINETDIILKQYRSPSSRYTSKEISIINQFKSLANRNFIEEKNVHFYADKLNMSVSLLYKILRKHGQVSPAQFLSKLLLDEAKYLLTNTEKHISEIAYQLNFNSIFSFSKYFKKQTDHSPSDYREKSKN